MAGDEQRNTEPPIGFRLLGGTSETAAIKRQLGTAHRRDRIWRIVGLLTAFRANQTKHVEAPLLKLLALGEVERRPFDISALAAVQGTPRTTVFRHLEDMRDQSLVKKSPNGRRSIVVLSDQGWREVAQICATYDRLVDELIESQTASSASEGRAA